jgi:hypothetical protein
VIAHPLAIPRWLHVVGTLEGHQRVDRTLLVAPPSLQVLARYEEVSHLARVGHHADRMAAEARKSHPAASDNDPTAREVKSVHGKLDPSLTSSSTSSPAVGTSTHTPDTAPGHQCPTGAGSRHAAHRARSSASPKRRTVV